MSKLVLLPFDFERANGGLEITLFQYSEIFSEILTEDEALQLRDWLTATFDESETDTLKIHE